MFSTKHKIVVLFGQSNYDACYKSEPDEDGHFQQGISNLETVQEDCKVLKKCLDKYQVRESDIINLSDDTETTRKLMLKTSE